jgi:hypothetical protein
VCAALVLSLGATAAFAAANAPNFKPDNVEEVVFDDGLIVRSYTQNLDEYGNVIQLTPDDVAAIAEALAPHDKNGNIIPPSEITGELKLTLEPVEVSGN